MGHYHLVLASPNGKFAKKAPRTSFKSKRDAIYQLRRDLRKGNITPNEMYPNFVLKRMNGKRINAGTLDNPTKLVKVA